MDNESEIATKTSKEHQKGRSSDIVTIPKPEGFYNIIYGLHLKAHKQSVIPEEMDGICPEFAGPQPHDDYGVRKFYQQLNQAQAIDYARIHTLPLYSTDLSINWQATLIDNILPVGIEWAVATALFNRVRKRLLEQPRSRRLLFGIVGKTALATYLSAPLNAGVVRAVAHTTGIEVSASREVLKKVEKMHPEIGTVTAMLRDVVAAQKGYLITQHDKRRHLAYLRGAAHVGLEEAIKASEQERLDFLERTTALLPFVQGEEPRDFYRIHKYTYHDRDGKWHMVDTQEKPGLLKIFQRAYNLRR